MCVCVCAGDFISEAAEGSDTTPEPMGLVSTTGRYLSESESVFQLVRNLSVKCKVFISGF